MKFISSLDLSLGEAEISKERSSLMSSDVGPFSNKWCQAKRHRCSFVQLAAHSLGESVINYVTVF